MTMCHDELFLTIVFKIVCAQELYAHVLLLITSTEKYTVSMSYLERNTRTELLLKSYKTILQ